MRRLTYHAEVESELISSAVYYEEQCERLGERFLDDYDRAVSEIAANPTAWPLIKGEYRRHQLRHFPFGIIYRVLSDNIRMLAIMHLHRHPDYWKDRT